MRRRRREGVGLEPAELAAADHLDAVELQVVVAFSVRAADAVAVRVEDVEGVRHAHADGGRSRVKGTRGVRAVVHRPVHAVAGRVVHGQGPGRFSRVFVRKYANLERLVADAWHCRRRRRRRYR